MKSKFLIVGSGASALGVIYGLLDSEEKISIDVITSEIFNQITGEPFKKRSLLVPEKSKNGKLVNKYTTYDKKLKLYDSKAHSMTVYWGAGMYISNEFNSYIGATRAEVTALANKIPIIGAEDDLNLNFNRSWKNKPRNTLKPNSLLKIGSARLAIRDNCIYCGRCMSGCDVDAIWSSATEIKKLKDSGKINIISGSVKKFGKSSITYTNEGKVLNLKIDEYKKIFLSAGVIGSSEILLNSDLGIKEVRFKDNPVITLPILSPKRPRTGITLANEFIIANSDIRPQLISVYPFFREIWDTVIFSGVSRIAILRKLIENHLGFIRIYTNADNPLQICMKNSKDQIEFSRDPWKLSRTDRVLLKNIKRVFRENFVYTLPIKLTNLTSAHYYGVNFDGVQRDEVISLLLRRNVIIADASVIDKMPAISPTFSIILSAYLKGLKHDRAKI